MKRTLSKREVTLLLTILCILVIALAYLLFFRPTLARLQTLQTQKQTLTTLLSTKGAQANSTMNSSQMGNGTGVSSAPAMNPSRLPPTPDEAGFLKTIADVGTQTHVLVTSVQVVSSDVSASTQTQVTSPTVSLPSLQFELHVEGTSAQIEAFLKGLQNAPRLINVTTISIQGNQGTPVQADFNVVAYYAPPTS